MPARTPDLYFAAFLIASEHAVSRTERPPENPKQVVFCFDDLDADEFKDLRVGYIGGTAMVQALAYSNAIRNLKSLVHSG